MPVKLCPVLLETFAPLRAIQGAADRRVRWVHHDLGRADSAVRRSFGWGFAGAIRSGTLKAGNAGGFPRFCRTDGEHADLPS